MTSAIKADRHEADRLLTSAVSKALSPPEGTPSRQALIIAGFLKPLDPSFLPTRLGVIVGAMLSYAEQFRVSPGAGGDLKAIPTDSRDKAHTKQTAREAVRNEKGDG